MKLLLTGRTGQVGCEMQQQLSSTAEVTAVGRRELDLNDADAIRALVRALKPDIIVNAAAYTAVDRAEAEPELAMRVNGIAPGIFAEEARRLGALLVHYSTDYVFDGKKRAPYTEEDATSPLCVYGATKLEGESRIRRSGCRHLILRTSWVYGPHGKNFYRSIRAKVAAKEPLRVVDDQWGVPTPSNFIARGTVGLLEKGASGLLHFVPSGSTTWFKFACAIVSDLGAPVAVQPITTQQFPTAARRPVYSVLDNAKARAALGQELPDWRALLTTMRESP